MYRKQLKDRLEITLHQLVHFETIHSGISADEITTPATAIYIGSRMSNIHLGAIISEHGRDRYWMNRHLPQKAEVLIKAYARTPLAERDRKYVIIVGIGRDDSYASYDASTGTVVDIPADRLMQERAFHFTVRQLRKFYRLLPDNMKRIARYGTIPLNDLEGVLNEG